MSIDIEKIITEAKEKGFDLAAPLDVATMNPLPEIRAMCNSEKCSVFGHNWACPPACGTIEECTSILREYSDGIIVQSIVELEDEFDFEGIQELGKRHSTNSINFTKYLRETYPEHNILPLAAGGCFVCKKCTYPDAPCRFPDMRLSPIEGYGIFVSDLCSKNNVPYNHGKGTLAYIGAFLFK